MTTPGQAPTPDDVRGLWAFMTAHYGTSVINKENAAEMQLVASMLDTLGIVDKQDFLLHYCTTIGRRIYVPFIPGTAFNEWDLWSQVIVVAHEHEHVEQEDALGLLTYGARYVGSPSTRADYEAEAYRSMLELNWWHSRTMPDPNKVARLLSGYGVSETDIAVVATTLREAAESVQFGAILNKATSVALSWLNEHAPHLRAS
jgi:hypothetical protein